MSEQLLSIIVPVYNVEEYLPHCINSLLDQGLTEKQYEIILVNDGSTDNSPVICQSYGIVHFVLHSLKTCSFQRVYRLSLTSFSGSSREMRFLFAEIKNLTVPSEIGERAIISGSISSTSDTLSTIMPA